MTKTLRIKEVLLKEQARMNGAARQDVAEGAELGPAFTQRYAWICDQIASLNATLEILLVRLDSRKSPIDAVDYGAPHSMHSLPRNRETQDVIAEGKEKGQKLVSQIIAPNAASEAGYSERLVNLVNSCMSLLYMIRVSV